MKNRKLIRGFMEWKNKHTHPVLNSKLLFYITDSEVYDDAYTIEELLKIYLKTNNIWDFGN
jgi:hypothetical protein